jgi:hypothetical protein
MSWTTAEVLVQPETGTVATCSISYSGRNCRTGLYVKKFGTIDNKGYATVGQFAK